MSSAGIDRAGPARLGLVGAGRWGQNIIRTVAAMPDARLARLASRNPAAATLAGRDCAIDADWKTLVKAGDLDGLIVATPPETHAEICLAAIGEGLPVFVEKPLTLDPAEAARITQASERGKVAVLVDHVHLFHESYERLKAEAARHGGIRSLASRGGNRGPFRPFPPLYDWGAHDIALMLDLCGLDAKIAAARQLKSEPHEGGAGALYEVTLGWPDGRKGSATFGNLLDRKERRLEAACADATLVMDDVAGEPLTIVQGGRARSLDVPRSQPLRRALDVFVHGLCGGMDARFGARLGQRVVEILADAERLMTGRVKATA